MFERGGVYRSESVDSAGRNFTAQVLESSAMGVASSAYWSNKNESVENNTNDDWEVFALQK